MLEYAKILAKNHVDHHAGKCLHPLQLQWNGTNDYLFFNFFRQTVDHVRVHIHHVVAVIHHPIFIGVHIPDLVHHDLVRIPDRTIKTEVFRFHQIGRSLSKDK